MRAGQIRTIQDAVDYLNSVIALEHQDRSPRAIASIIVGNMLREDRVDELCESYPLLSDIIEEAAGLEWLNGYAGEGHLDAIRQLISALSEQVGKSSK